MTPHRVPPHRDPHNRTVHAVLPGLVEIVRYDRAAKWYAERTDGRARKLVTLAQAAAIAVLLRGRGGCIHERPHGEQFRAFLRTVDEGHRLAARRVLADLDIPGAP